MRLFVAITLDEGVRSVLGRVQNQLRPVCNDAKWVAVHLIHLTVKFLGEVRDEQVPEVARAIEAAAARSAPFEMTVAKSGCFPPRGGVRVIWVGVDEPSGALLRCVQAVEDELASVGFEPEQRPFSAHVTLGRVREDRTGGKIRSAVTGCSFEASSQSVKSLTLMSSVLSPKGPAYTPVATVKLIGG